jgi:amino acid transporter
MSGSVPKSPVFVRQATGLVRSMNWVDLLFLNVVSFGGAWSIIYALTYAPYYGGDPALSLVLTAPGILALLGVYYIFNVSMPRSGGDYVYTSRVLHPAVGFAANFAGYTMFLWFWIGDAASVFSNQGMEQTLSVYGALTKSSWASNAAAVLARPTTDFVIGTIAIAAFTLVVIFSTRLYFWIQNIFMTIAVIGLVVMAILLAVALANPAAFQTHFNQYAIAVNPSNAALTPNPYANISASSGVTSPPGIGLANFKNNVMLIPLWFTVLFWVFVSNYCGGETKNVKQTAKRALFGSFAIVFLSTLIILEVAYYALGFPFILGADNIYYGYVTNTLGAPPNLTLFVAILANNAPLVLFLGIGIVAGFILVAPQCMILMSRILFSYSFDRLAPASLADVNSRFSTPVKAILVAAVGGEVMLFFLSGILGGTSQTTALALYSWAGLAAIGLTFVFVSISAILFPYRRKQLYEVACVVKRKVAGVPVITWLGIIALAYCVATITSYTSNQVFYLFGCPAGGVAACDYNYFLVGLAIIFVASIVYYVAIRSYRVAKGIPFDAAFAEIPPE